MDSEHKTKTSAELKKKLSDCLREKQEYLEGWQRSRAEFVNYKKAELERNNDFIKQANKDILIDLLDVLDDMERLEQEIDLEDEDDVVFDGFKKIKRKFLNLFEKWGVVRIETVDHDFDPEKHEAVERVFMEKIPEGLIIEEVSAGYLLNGKTLRPARVKVTSLKKKEQNN